MEDNEFDDTLKKLSQQVESFTPVSKKSKGLGISLPAINSPFMIYIAVPVAISIILMLTRPKIILYEKTSEKGEKNMKLSFKKLLFATVLLSVAIFISYYFIKNKFAKNSNTKEEF